MKDFTRAVVKFSSAAFFTLILLVLISGFLIFKR